MSLNLQVQNVGGIYRGTATIEEGVNAVQASNWQGKSSLIAAIEAVMGTEASLTEGESTGRVVLSGEERYDVELRREGETVEIEGTPYLVDEHDRVCARLFAFLDETNPVRRAVREGANLEDVLTRPLDFEDIDARIAERRAERERIDRELQRARDDERALLDLKRRAERLESAVAVLAERRSGLREEIGKGGGSDELSELKAEREQVTDLIERLQNTIERTSETLSGRYEDLEALAVPERADVEESLVEATGAVREAERDIDLLRTIYSAHQRLLEEDRVGLLSEVDHGVLDDGVTCWVCGNATGRAELEAQLEQLGERVADLESELESARERRAELERRRDEVVSAKRRKRDLEDEISKLESTLVDREESLQSAKGRLSEVAERIDGMEETDAAVTTELTDVESELKYQRAELEEVEEELARRRAGADRVGHLESEREAATAEIERLRNRKSEVRRETREAFDRALADVVERFDTGFEGARLSADFDLVVARNGRAVEWAALSEGEQELLGFVAALAGYEVFDVAETVPFMLLDRLGSLADDNLHRLVEYLEDRTEYLVLTAYPENAPFEGATIDPRSWTVVSTEREAGAA